jgi:hypothetical protein
MRRYRSEYEIQPKDQLCFMHMAKTGGTTLTAILDSKFDLAEICPEQLWPTLLKLSPKELANYRLLRGHFFYRIHKLLPRPPVFLTLFRNPIDRIVSTYYFCRGGSPEHLNPEADATTFYKAKSLTLGEFVRHPSLYDCENAQTYQFIARKDIHTAPLNHRSLEEAKAYLNQFAFVGITERFDEALQLLSFTFGWNPLKEHQPLMVSPTRTRRSSLSPDIIEVIRERNQFDFALYDYATALFELRYQQMRETLQQRYKGTVYEQLEQHYQQRQRQRQLAARSQILFTFDQARSGAGWQLRELLKDDVCFCWTGPNTVSTLDLPLTSDRPLVLDCALINAITPDVFTSIQLCVNNHLVPLTVLAEPSGTVLRGQLLPSVLTSDRNFVRLAFQVDRTLSPQSLDPTNPDHRLLGLAFRWIKIYAPITVEFPEHDLAWVEVAEFVQQHLRDRDEMLAPAKFAARFPAQVLPYPTPTQKITLPAWVIVHKGQMHQLGRHRLQQIRSQFTPVFSNAVFVVFAAPDRKLNVQAETEHLTSFDNQLEQLQQPTWLKAVRRLVRKST